MPAPLASKPPRPVAAAVLRLISSRARASPGPCRVELCPWLRQLQSLTTKDVRDKPWWRPNRGRVELWGPGCAKGSTTTCAAANATRVSNRPRSRWLEWLMRGRVVELGAIGAHKLQRCCQRHAPTPARRSSGALARTSDPTRPVARLGRLQENREGTADVLGNMAKKKLPLNLKSVVET